MNFLKEINEFFEATTIHGFAYISNVQKQSTRFIWIVIVSVAMGAACYFLFHTIEGFSTKYVSTTIETRSIQEFPFPAVTFHPGDYNSKDAFLRNFLNQFEFTRHNEKSPLKDNVKFLDLYSWIVSPMNNDIFDTVEEVLINDQPYKIILFSTVTQILQ